MTCLNLIRLVIETTSPMAINTGGRESGFDTQLARDINGLPYLPATSLTGVWRHLAADMYRDAADEQEPQWIAQWFGGCERASRLTVGNGWVHDSANKPVLGLHDLDTLTQDPLLALLLQTKPHYRERVKLNDRGVAEDQAKFDQIMLPAGVRFCIDLQWKNLTHDPLLTEQWQQLLALWQSPHFMLGATTRNGLGRFKVIGCEQQGLMLRANPQAGLQITDFMRHTTIPTECDLASAISDSAFAVMPLKGWDNWRCGSGTSLLGEAPATGNVAQITYSEKVIEWHTVSGDKQQGALSEQPKAVLCGSSIKGMLAHRIAYHYRRHTAQWAETFSEADHQTWQQRPDALKALFGDANDSDNNQAQAGCLVVDDCVINYQHTVIRQHNSIDRFTGGVRQGALYSEELLYQPEFTIVLRLTKPIALSTELQAALNDTLNDLKHGLLPLGAGSGRGTSLVSEHPGAAFTIDWSQITVIDKSGETVCH